MTDEETGLRLKLKACCEREQSAIRAAAEVEYELFSLKEWLKGKLQNCVHVATKDERGHIVNGFAAIQIPDWEVKQRLDEIAAALAGSEGK